MLTHLKFTHKCKTWFESPFWLHKSYLTLMNCDQNKSGYVKLTITCNYRNILCGSLRTRQEVKQQLSHRKCLGAVKKSKNTSLPHTLPHWGDNIFQMSNLKGVWSNLILEKYLVYYTR